jgi:outer membrane biosynthesis protein TonB
VNNPTSPEQQVLLAEIAEAKKALEALHSKLDAIDEQANNLSDKRRQYQLLEGVEAALTELEELGSAELFWGKRIDEAQRKQHLERVRESVTIFQGKIDDIEKLKEPLYRQIREQNNAIADLNEDLADLRDREEAAKYEYPVTREVHQLPYRPMLMPWSRSGEDEWRFRKSLAAVLLFVLAFSSLINLWVLPEPDENEVVEIPENLVKLVKKEKPIPKPPEKRPEEQKPETAEEKPSDSKPKPSEKAKARKKAERSGVLAFKDSFKDLLGDDATAKLGSAARISTKGAKAAGDSNRNLVMAQATSSSSGINTAGLSRQVGGGGGSKIGGVSFSRVTSDIGDGTGADERPLSDGPGPSRTDEEIQIVFDRYKATLYRIYNRELRKNPILKGKMMLRITIKPNGSVSACKLESTDMDAPDLVKRVLARVKKFNFGAKKGVPTITILYPIDFLPAS